MERALKAWNSGKWLKESFPIIRVMPTTTHRGFNLLWKSRSNVWLDLIDKKFNPSTIHDPYDKELLTLEQVYFWTVLTKALKNPLCITALQEHLPQDDHETPPDAMSCYFWHQFLQGHSLAQPLHVASLRSDSMHFHIKWERGTQVEFLTKWFGKLQLLNHAQGNPIDVQDIWPNPTWCQANAHSQSYFLYPPPTDDDHSITPGIDYHPNLHMCSPAWEGTTNTVTYSVSQHISDSAQDYGLVDGGAIGIIAGEECIWIGGPVSVRKLNVTGIDKHQLNNIPVGSVGLLSISNQGPVVLIINEAAYTGRHTTILSRVQIEVYNNNVDNWPVSLGGRQRIITPEGYVFPLSLYVE